jgi:hypothetical protein
MEGFAKLVRAQKCLKCVGWNTMRSYGQYINILLDAIATHAPSLRVLQFTQCDLSEAEPLNWLPECTDLRTLVFASCTLSDAAIGPIKKAWFSRLSALRVINCKNRLLKNWAYSYCRKGGMRVLDVIEDDLPREECDLAYDKMAQFMEWHGTSSSLPFSSQRVF